jgi:hypothetical protein
MSIPVLLEELRSLYDKAEEMGMDEVFLHRLELNILCLLKTLAQPAGKVEPQSPQ